MTTLTMRRILFATDFLESSRLALDYALAIAHHFDAEILMLHAIELPPAAHEAEAVTHLPSVSRKLAQQALENLAQKVRRAGVRVRTRLVEGVPSTAILEVTRAERFDLLVLGVHGIHRGLSHLLLGSNTEKIVLAAPCPTLTVGAHVCAGVDLDLHLKAVVYLATASGGDSGADYAQQMANAYQVPLKTEYLAGTTEQEQEVGKQVTLQHADSGDDGLQELDSSAPPPTGVSRQVHSPLALLHRAHPGANHLIVTTVDSESFLERHLRPSFAYELIANAVSPVITINTAFGAAGNDVSRSPPR